MRRQRRSNTRGFLRASLQRVMESRWQQQTGTWKTQCQAQKTGNIKQTTAWATQKERMDAKIQHWAHVAQRRTSSRADELYPEQHRSTSPTRPFRAHGNTWGRGLGRKNTERCRCGREHRPPLLVPNRYFTEEGEVECHDMRLHDVLFKLLVDSGSAKCRSNRSLRTFWRHENLSMKMAVVTTTHLSSQPRRWLSKAKGEGLDCHVRDVARKNVVAMVPRQRLQDQEENHPHAEVRQPCLPRLPGKSSHRDNRKGHWHARIWIPTGDTLRKVYPEECQRVGDRPKRDPSEDHIQSRSNIERGKAIEVRNKYALFVSMTSDAGSMRRAVRLGCKRTPGCQSPRLRTYNRDNGVMSKTKDTFPQAKVPNEASYWIVCTFLVAEEVKSKMTRGCNLGQVGVFHVQYKYAASLLMTEQFQERIPHVVREIFTKARRGRNRRSWDFHYLSWRVKRVRGEKGWEQNHKWCKCVRESHKEPDEEHSTNSHPEVTMLLQF